MSGASPDLLHETAFLAEGYACVAGIDEAGRGPLAGPVVAAAVILPAGFRLDGLNDSKKLTAARRERLYDALSDTEGLSWAVAEQDAAEIDRINVLKACHKAMAEAFEALNPRAEAALIDGLPVPDFPAPQRALVGGDSLSLSIAAASIFAKVWRDRLMVDFGRQYPEYGFESHKGYGTKRHLEALQRHGPCPIHRRSFAPVAQCALGPRGSD